MKGRSKMTQFLLHSWSCTGSGAGGSRTAATRAAFPKEKRAKYDTDMITEWDHENMMYSAEMKGRKEGLAEGKAEGKAEVARAMLAASMPVGQIVALTGLTEEQVRRLE